MRAGPALSYRITRRNSPRRRHETSNGAFRGGMARGLLLGAGPALRRWILLRSRAAAARSRPLVSLPAVDTRDSLRTNTFGTDQRKIAPKTCTDSAATYIPPNSCGTSAKLFLRTQAVRFVKLAQTGVSRPVPGPKALDSLHARRAQRGCQRFQNRRHRGGGFSSPVANTALPDRHRRVRGLQ
jgi:hypothetical protein